MAWICARIQQRWIDGPLTPFVFKRLRPSARSTRWLSAGSIAMNTLEEVAWFEGSPFCGIILKLSLVERQYSFLTSPMPRLRKRSIVSEKHGSFLSAKLATERLNSIARAAITKRLIKHHGFTTVAVEADRPDAHYVDRFVRLRSRPTMKEPAFSRFPTWMWRNTEVHDFITWLHDYNSGLPFRQRIGFYGLDLYSLYASIKAVTTYLERVNPHAANLAKQRYGCLSPWIMVCGR